MSVSSISRRDSYVATESLFQRACDALQLRLAQCNRRRYYRVDGVFDLRLQRFEVLRYFGQHGSTIVFDQQLQKVAAFVVTAGQFCTTGFCEQAGQEFEPLLVAECRVAEVFDKLALTEQLRRDRE